jgi:hypothetical protein
MIGQLVVALLFWLALFALIGVVALGAVACYRTLFGWPAGEEWTR